MDSFDFTTVYSPERAILNLSGLFQRKTFNWKFYLHFSSNVALVLTMFMVVDLSNITDFVGQSVLIIAYVGYLFKILCLSWKQDLLLEIEDILQNPQLMECSEEEQQMINKQLQGVVNLARIQRVVTVFYMCNVTLKPLYAAFRGGKRYLPYNAWRMYDLDVNWYFYGTVIYQFSSIMISGMNNTGIDVLCCKVSSIICCQIDLFIKRSGKLDCQQRGDIILLLKNLVKHHYKIIKLVQTLNDVFSPIALIQCMTSVLVICFVAFILTADTASSADFIKQTSFFFCIFLQIYFYCWYGQNIILKSKEISNSYYSTNWYDESSSEIRKYLFLIMERSKQPLTLYAGGVFPLSMRTLMSILKSSYSYMAVLQRLNSR